MTASTATATAPAVIVDPAAIRRQRILGVVYLLIAAATAYFLTAQVTADQTNRLPQIVSRRLKRSAP